MLNVMWKIDTKIATFEVEDKGCNYIATVTAKKSSIKGCLEIDISISDLDEGFTISCYSRTTPLVRFQEKDIEEHAVAVLEEYGEQFIEYYDQTVYEWFGV